MPAGAEKELSHAYSGRSPARLECDRFYPPSPPDNGSCLSSVTQSSTLATSVPQDGPRTRTHRIMTSECSRKGARSAHIAFLASNRALVTAPQGSDGRTNPRLGFGPHWGRSGKALASWKQLPPNAAFAPPFDCLSFIAATG
jgi:hypothetical protein